MIDDELAWQRREITGEIVHVCEKCGRPMSDDYLRQAADETTADGGAGLRICTTCYESIERGTEPVELDEDDDVTAIR